MKKIICYILVIVLLFCCLACGCANDKNEIYSVLASTTRISNIPKASKPLTILIDAGHGFDDPGCVNGFSKGYESDITIAIAKFLKADLESAGIKVILTHDGKTFPSAKSIKESANKLGVDYDSSKIKNNNIFSAYERLIYASNIHKQNPVDLLISLHINSIEGYPDINRYELYYCETNKAADDLSLLCDLVSDMLDAKAVTFASTKGSSYIITRNNEFPSLLVEMGYSTNKAQSKNLASTSWQQKFSEAIAINIVDWFNNMET